MVLLITAGFFPAAAQTPNEKQEALAARQKAFFDAIIAKKYEFLTDSLAADYIGTYRLGIIDKEHEARDLRAFPLAEYWMTEIKTAFPNK